MLQLNYAREGETNTLEEALAKVQAAREATPLNLQRRHYSYTKWKPLGEVGYLWGWVEVPKAVDVVRITTPVRIGGQRG